MQENDYFEASNFQDPVILKLLVRDALLDAKLNKKTLWSSVRGWFETPVVGWQDTYNSFLSVAGENGDLLDQWINFQIGLLSDMGEGRDLILKKFLTIFNRSIVGIPTTSQMTDNDISESQGYIVGLITRVYGAMVELPPEQESDEDDTPEGEVVKS